MDQASISYTLQIINSVLQLLSLIFLIMYVIKTWEMASATRRAAEATEKSVVEMKETRDQETAPYIVVYFDVPTESSLIYLVVKNIGRSVANKIRLEFTPPLRSSMKVAFADMSFIKDGIESIPPEYEIRTILDGAPSYFGNSDFPLKYTVKISYFGGLQANERSHEQILDLSAHKGLTFVIQKNIGHLVDEVEHLKREFQGVRKAINNVAETLSDGIFISNPSLSITTVRPGMSNWAELLLAKLREFENIWMITYKDERLQGIHTSRIQRHALYLGSQLLLLLANRPSNASVDLIDRVSALCEQLGQIGKMRFYMDGGASMKTFNERGDQIVEQIRNTIESVEKPA